MLEQLKLHIGTKLIKSIAMTLGDYNNYQGWTIPEDQDPSTKGFLVEYLDGGKANHKDHEGYISWSPEHVFDGAYQDVTKGVSFGAAIVLLKLGKKVARKGWNGKGMWLILVPGSENIKPVAGTPYSKAGIVEEVQILPHIDMYTIDSSGRRAMMPGWWANCVEMISDDWVLVE
jgi:hypothetical protein